MINIHYRQMQANAPNLTLQQQQQMLMMMQGNVNQYDPRSLIRPGMYGNEEKNYMQ